MAILFSSLNTDKYRAENYLRRLIPRGSKKKCSLSDVMVSVFAIGPKVRKSIPS